MKKKSTPEIPRLFIRCNGADHDYSQAGIPENISLVREQLAFVCRKCGDKLVIDLNG
jgi:hypothetical protein